jgi:hypothetical protein
VSTKTDEEQIKEQLGITTWRELSKDKFFDFLQLSPRIDKELHLKILEQVPNFVTLTKEVLANITAIVEQNEKSTTEVIEALKLIINSLDNFAQKDDLTEEEKKLYVEAILKVADILDGVKKRDQDFLKEVTKNKMYISGFALLVLAVILGVQRKPSIS